MDEHVGCQLAVGKVVRTESDECSVLRIVDGASWGTRPSPWCGSSGTSRLLTTPSVLVAMGAGATENSDQAALVFQTPSAMAHG